jgi:hypothetical protein
VDADSENGASGLHTNRHARLRSNNGEEIRRQRATVSTVSNGFSAVGSALEFVRAAASFRSEGAPGTLEEIGRVL